jgi:hypothetical protein
MRFLVGRYTGRTAVYIVNGELAINLTAIEPGIGSDLLTLIESGLSLNKVAQLCAEAPAVPVSQIVPALPIAKPGKFVCLGLTPSS